MHGIIACIPASTFWNWNWNWRILDNNHIDMFINYEVWIFRDLEVKCKAHLSHTWILMIWQIVIFFLIVGHHCKAVLITNENGEKCSFGEQLLLKTERDSFPKNVLKILSSFTHPQVVPNLYEFISSVEHTHKMSVTKQLMGTIDSPPHPHPTYYGSQLLPSSVNCLITHILKNVFFCVQKQKEIQMQIWTNDKMKELHTEREKLCCLSYGSKHLNRHNVVEDVYSVS